ncbi:MAG: NAD(+)/NADH kinase [Clostridia bacterium]|nr:NAD(+)/NADH kinase [Clostridia bacterium]
MDIAIVLGGDGSILNASTLVCSYNIPILGINFGTLGYMAELEASDIAKVKDVLAGKYQCEERMMLSAKIQRSDKSTVMMPPALNDIVLSNGPIARLLNFNVSCNGVLIEKCRADGLVVATPTGSTAYSMSAGGPILAPVLNAFCLTPICPHSFGSRPVILNGDDTVTLSDIRVVKDNAVYLTVDGRLAEKVNDGDMITVSRSKLKTSLIRLKDNSFLSVLNSKLQDI